MKVKAIAVLLVLLASAGVSIAHHDGSDLLIGGDGLEDRDTYDLFGGR